jgi:hypothetical protein
LLSMLCYDTTPAHETSDNRYPAERLRARRISSYQYVRSKN